MKAALWSVVCGEKGGAVFMNYVGVDIHKKVQRAVRAG